ncbi:hypothetical protein [Thermococcus henrietii]|uniref:hypothetical protein n=1 Tax=Thermococcus henrietii TaxID=2016361 RepID=UPI0011AB8E3A|nr:hypothetical protein [Thermococcus henrietii]
MVEMEAVPEFIGLNVGFMLLLLWVFEPLSPTFALVMALFMGLGVVLYRVYREVRILPFIRSAPFEVKVGRASVFTDDERFAEVLRGGKVPSRGLPRFVYVGSYPSEVETRMGVLAGVINTDVFEGSVEDALSSLKKPPLWWVDFTSPLGFLVRVLLPAVALRLPLKTATAVLIVAGIVLGLVDSINLNMTSV